MELPFYKVAIGACFRVAGYEGWFRKVNGITGEYQSPGICYSPQFGPLETVFI